jgi:putative DNA primase/helicase
LGENRPIDIQDVSKRPPKPSFSASLRKPDLIVDSGDLPATARAMRDLLAGSGRLFDRGVPVRVVRQADGRPPIAERLTANRVVVEAHQFCRPVKPQGDDLMPVTQPNRVARMYLDLSGEWALPLLTGISTAPVLAADGTVRTAEGYDHSTGLWCAGVPKLQLPEYPSRARAEAGLRLLREAFRIFPFGDGVRRKDTALGLEVLDLDELPGHDESTLLVGLLTAVCRPNLWLAPGVIVRAPEISGAGTGKGLLVRSVCAIAFGVPPRAFTKGGARQELDKRLASDLIEAAPTVFLDNANGSTLRSETLASVLTERPARVRLLGQSRMVALNSTAFIAVTGNGLSVSEDLAPRRFIVCELDARCEDPEQRQFRGGLRTPPNLGYIIFPSAMKERDLVDFSRMSVTSFCAGDASHAFAFSMLSKAITTIRFGAVPSRGVIASVRTMNLPPNASFAGPAFGPRVLKRSGLVTSAISTIAYAPGPCWALIP